MAKRRSKPSGPRAAPGAAPLPGAKPERTGRGRWFGLGALVLGATVLAYLPALSAGFIWNDSDYVTAPALRSLGGLERIWFELGATEQYYPLLHSFFWLQHRVFGDNPAGYHVVNLLLHLGAVALLAAALRRLLVSDSGLVAAGHERRRYAGVEWLGAAFFALHPVHVATVAWITEQKNTFSLVLYLAAFLAYLRFDATRQPRHYGFALALFALSILGKTSTVTLPAALLVVFWWWRGRIDWRSDVKPLLPWFALGAAAGIFSSWVERHYLGGAGLGAHGAEFDLSPAGHVLLAGRAVWFYLGSLVWPFDLNFIYPRWTIDGSVWWQWLFPVAAVALGAGLWAWRRRDRTPLAVGLLFGGTLFPVLGFVNLYGALYSRVWDHWQYLADLAPLALAGVALGRMGTRQASVPQSKKETPSRERVEGRALAGVGLAHAGVWAGPRLRRAGPALGVALCLLLGALTWRRCGDFRDNETLYRTTLARNPGSWMAHNNLGQILAATPGGLPEALAQYEAAVRLSPGVPELHDNLGNALAKAGRLDEAVDQYHAALRLDPDYLLAHNNLGNTYARMEGRLPEAITEFEAALRLDPSAPDVHNNLGIALLMAGRTTEAIREFEATLRLNPNLAQAHMNLAAALESVGRTREAAEQYAAARRLGFAVPPANP